MLYKNKSAKNRELEFLKRKLKNIENENYFLRMRMQSFENSLTWRINRKIDKFLNLFLPNGSKIKEAYINAIMASNILFSQGISGLFRAINFRYRGQKTRKLDKEKIKTEIESFSNKPKISIIMPVYNVDSKWLNLAIRSVTNQLYKNWELCIADDGSDNEDTIRFLKSINNDRVRVKFLKENQGIAGASNEALGLATGDYVALLDNDDELSQDALYEVVKAINKSDPDLIYSDEDKIDMKGRHVEPHFKPDFSLDMFFSCNYLCHLSVFRKSILDSIGGFRKGFEGSQDYDLLLRYTEKAKKIHHIPKILYHWRKIKGSVSKNYDDKNYAWDAGKKALEEALIERTISGKVLLGKRWGLYRVKRKIFGNPLVSIIIPFKDKAELLERCIDSIINKSIYQNYEIILINNCSEEKKTRGVIQRLERNKKIRYYEYDLPFNYSKINNYGVSVSNGEHVLLLNSDTEVVNPDWIECLLEHSQRPEIGAVGAKLYYKDNKIQHGGIIIGIQGVAGHSHKGFSKIDSGYFSRIFMIQNISAVTGACLMIKKSLYEEIGGLDEENLKIAFNDVDFCLRLIESDYLNVFTPYAELYHYESASRGLDTGNKERKRFNDEANYIKKRHREILEKGDPYYNPNLSLQYEDFRIKPLS